MLDHRFSKDQLVKIFQSLKDAGSLDRELEAMIQGLWDQQTAKTGDISNGPEICWNSQSISWPLSMNEMTEEEKQVRMMIMALIDAKSGIDLHIVCQFSTETATRKGLERHRPRRQS